MADTVIPEPDHKQILPWPSQALWYLLCSGGRYCRPPGHCTKLVPIATSSPCPPPEVAHSIVSTWGSRVLLQTKTLHGLDPSMKTSSSSKTCTNYEFYSFRHRNLPKMLIQKNLTVLTKLPGFSCASCLSQAISQLFNCSVTSAITGAMLPQMLQASPWGSSLRRGVRTAVHLTYVLF